MASVNKVILIGNLGVDPEVRFTQGGNAVANFRIATGEAYTDKSGQRQERTEWHRIVAWGKTAELCGEYLRKGRKVYVEGRLQTREWTDKENVKHYTTEVVANNVVFLSPQGAGAEAAPGGGMASGAGGRGSDDFAPPATGYDSAPPRGGAPSEDDIPF